MTTTIRTDLERVDYVEFLTAKESIILLGDKSDKDIVGLALKDPAVRGIVRFHLFESEIKTGGETIPVVSEAVNKSDPKYLGQVATVRLRPIADNEGRIPDIETDVLKIILFRDGTWIPFHGETVISATLDMGESPQLNKENAA